MGTWQMGEHGKNRHHEIAALHHSLDLGLNRLKVETIQGSLIKISVAVMTKCSYNMESTVVIR